MHILFDQGTPAPLRGFLPVHKVNTAYEMGWSTLDNGDLLEAAESSSFELFITTDKNLRYQQNLPARRIAILVLPTTRWPQIRLHTNEIVAAVNHTKPGGYRELDW